MAAIYVAETCDRKEFVSKIMKNFKKQITRANKIFIKPNIVSSETYPTTTHPQILDSVLDHISGKEVIVGDGHAVDTGYTKNIIENSPLKQICSHHGIELVDLYNKKMKKWTSPRGYTIEISMLPLECDYVISLPVLKVHKQCGLSGALKNQFGYLSKLNRILMHTKIKNIHKGIAEVNVACSTHLFIVDAVKTLTEAQECRHGGCQVKLNTMLAGTDPVSLDSLGQKLLQKVDPNIQQNIRHLNYAEQYGVGKKDFEVIKI